MGLACLFSTPNSSPFLSAQNAFVFLLLVLIQMGERGKKGRKNNKKNEKKKKKKKKLLTILWESLQSVGNQQ